ncbi:MAG TPA: XdhC family protein [Tepidisphaeraceae bacterium]|jgi:xanthine/CO dehydrogenase XdhC/CoxF family maturation factor
MRELAQILEAFEHLAAEGKPAAVATVVAVGGSSYRRPGARMLVAGDGRTWGGISGGCLERDVARRARLVIETGEPVLCRYDTTESLDEVTEETGLLDLGRTPGVTLGCRGVIDLFIERISSDWPGPIPLMARAVRERTVVTCGTLLRATPGVKARPGTRLLAASESPTGGDELARAVTDRLRAHEAYGILPLPLGEGARGAAIANVTYGAIHHLVLPGDESADVFIETMRPPQSLVIFGGGSDVVPLLELAKALGWHVTIVAGRSSAGARERFATADVFAAGDADDPTAGVTPETGAAVVLMTHDFPRDAKVLAALAGRPLRYLGLLGPRNRAERLLAQCAGTAQWKAFYPVGLDVGADNPELIALAIIAEIQAVLAGRPGGMLRDRPGPIYSRAQAPA